MKKLISTLTALAIAAAVFTSCVKQDNSATAKETGDHDKVPISQIWDGYEELQGKNFGAFKLPDVITIEKPDKMYSFYSKQKEGIDLKQAREQFFRAMAGDSYNESFIRKESENTYVYHGEDGFTMDFTNGMPINAYYDGVAPPSGETLGVSFPETDKDTPLELKYGTFTVSEICEGLSGIISKAFYPLYDGFEIYPYKLWHRIDENMEKYVEVTCGIRYEGLTMEVFFSPLFDSVKEAEYDIITTYAPSYLQFDLDSDNRLRFFVTGFAPRDVEAEEITEMISLKGAVELLKENLAPHSGYQFEKVELLYCCKSSGPALDGRDPEHNIKITEAYAKDHPDEPPATFVPTWCFYWTVGNKYCDIKVNALTGEITVEV